MVEISDYLCPHCQQSYPDVKAALKELGNDVKFVQINFSLRPSKLSGSLIEGAYCASQQGDEQFWKYHDAAFAKKWGTMNDGADLAKAEEIGKEAGLDAAKLKECLNGEGAKKFVTETNEVVSSLGVTGTPTFFVNGRRLAHSHGTPLASQIREAISSKNTN